MMPPDQVFELFDRQPQTFRRIPVATYRLQLDRTLTFAAAREIVPYLDALGVTDCYLSPFFQASSGESHGYDVSDHGRFDATLGTEAEYRAFADALRARGMGQLIDVVPNHMGIAGSRNAWWSDVLENGPASPYASYFDIDWDPAEPGLEGKILLPILGDQYGRVLENGELTLEFRDGAFVVRYWETVLPVSPRSSALVLRLRLDELAKTLGEGSAHVLELTSILTALTHLPPRTETDPERLAERTRERQVIRRRLATLTAESPDVRAFIEENVRILNGSKGEPAGFDRLDELLGAQVYRLAFWQVAADEINYRRFFDINTLAAIRVEEPAVFEEAHRLIFRLVRDGCVTGLRVDHPDGLFAPGEYFRQLQRRCFLEMAHARAGIEAASEGERNAWRDAVLVELDRRVQEGAAEMSRPFYIVAEKILTAGERLPAEWPIHGTTGYDFLNAVNGILVDTAAARALDETYARFVGARIAFRELAYESKKLIIEASMASEINMLGHRLARLAQSHRASRDFTRRSLTTALREIIACFPVYRTYVGEAGTGVAERDQWYVDLAVAMAKRRNPTISKSIFNFIADLLCLRFPEARSEADRLAQRTFVGKFQQLTGPITAKGLEDTAFYRYNRLISLNEVGGAPDRFGISVAEFHRVNAERGAAWPGSLSATSTHDTKRGEDVRARIDVLSEIPREWRTRVRRWHRINRRRKATVDGQPAPDTNEEYLLYQTLVGAWPIGSVSDAEYADFTERIQRFMFKALREAKVNVSWINPRPEYDDAVRQFIDAILDRSAPNPFLDDFLPFQGPVARWGMFNALSQTLLKLTAPGVPDLYQGSELWDLSLVDPDNRRPVDFALRRRLLQTLDAAIRATPDLAALARLLVEALADGRAKLYLIRQALAFRRARAALFRDGDYKPIDLAGPLAEHVCAFARTLGSEAALTLVPRLLARRGVEGPPLGRDWWGSETGALVPGGTGARFRNVLTGERLEARDGALALGDVLASFPVALLARED